MRILTDDYRIFTIDYAEFCGVLSELGSPDNDKSIYGYIKSELVRKLEWEESMKNRYVARFVTTDKTSEIFILKQNEKEMKEVLSNLLNNGKLDLTQKFAGETWDSANTVFVIITKGSFRSK